MAATYQRRGAPEKQAQQAIRQYLRLRGARLYDLSQPRPTMQHAGLPDILAFLPPYGLLMIEVKSAVGRQTDSQREFAALCQVNGVVYLLVRSAAELAAQLDALRE